MRSYNEVNHKEYNSYDEWKSVFFTLDGEKSNTNLFVGVVEDECRDKLDTPAFKGLFFSTFPLALSLTSIPFCTHSRRAKTCWW